MAPPTKLDLLAYLKNTPSRSSARLISSQIADFRDQSISGGSGEYARIQAATGKLPGMYSGVLGDFFIPEEATNGWPDNQTQLAWHVNNAIAHWNALGLVGFSFVMNNLGTGNTADYTIPSPNLSAILGGAALCNPWVGGVHLSNKTIYQLLDRQLIAPLQSLQAAGVVVILRMFHEMNSGFWWGSANTSSADYITMWQLIYNYVVAKGLANNVIWHYSVIPGNGGYTTAFPGSAFVDVVGLDYYSPDGRIPAGIAGWSSLQTLGKPMAFSELGLQTYSQTLIPRDFNVAMADIETNYPDAALFMTWWGVEDWSGELNLSTALARPWLANLPVSVPHISGINYTASGAYADLDFAALGGVYATPASIGPRLGKIGPRWVMVDTLGKVMLLRGLYRVGRDDFHVLGGTVSGGQSGRTLSGNVTTKYGATSWRDAQGARIRQFQFNWVGKDSPEFNQGGGMQLVSQADVMLQAAIKSSMQSVTGNSEPIKSLVPALNPAANGFGSYGRFWGDVFDPKYAQFAGLYQTIWADPRILFFQSDDGDFTSLMSGMGHPNEVAGVDDIQQNYGFHGGALALISRLIVTSQFDSVLNATTTWSTDTVFHTKRALLDFLIAKYGTIGALNTAWNTGGFYTSFETVGGGWGVGTGLADEDGNRAHAWFGTPATPQIGGPNNLIDSTRFGAGGTMVTSSFGLGSVTAMKDDLDVFLFKIWEAYLKPNRDHIKAVRPGALYIGSTGQGSRAPALAAYNQYTDLTMGGGYFAAGNTHILNPFAKARTDWERAHQTIPYITSEYTACQADSCLYYKGGNPLTDTQQNNGQNLASIIDAFMHYQAPDGTFPFLGYIKWGCYDQPEETGWGLFSCNDNPYDGRDYRLAQADPYTAGLTTITEDFAYGDQLTPVTNAHTTMFATLQSQLGPGIPIANFTFVVTPGTRTVLFTDTTSANPAATAWTWDYGDSFTSAQQSPSHTYVADGTYVVGHTATNSVGTSTTVTQSVTVLATATAASAVPGGYVCTF